MTLPAGLPTHELSTTKNYSRLDNVFMTEGLINLVDKCDAIRAPRIAATDHFSIHTVLRLATQQADLVTRRCFKKTNWEEFETALRARLTNAPTRKIRSTREFDTRLNELITAIQATIAEHVPEAKESPHAKRWWNKTLKKMRRKRNKLSNRLERRRDEPHHCSRGSCDLGFPVHVHSYRDHLLPLGLSIW
ncbi:hypothetical protein BDV93DRAFT_453956 [Ceratobasidium sp. AG-I]|nr:hypothetical protein BDV93DRAFT_453956 [Ceratobasidium sp. AG-I]